MADRLHELNLKLVCLTCTAQYAVQQLLALFAQQSRISNFANNGDVNIALAEILQHYFQLNQLKDFQTLKYDANRKKIFTGAGCKTVKSPIEIECLDLTPLVEILEKIPDFPSYKDFQKLSLVCSNCCKHKNVVCCNKCKFCSKCSNVYDSHGIRNDLKEIHGLRNRTSHITTEECLEIEKGLKLKLPNPLAVEWKNKIKCYCNAIKHVLAILCKHGKITAEEEKGKVFDVDMVIFTTKSTCINHFSESLEKLLTIRKIFNRTLELKFLISSDMGKLNQIKDIDSDVSRVVFYSVEQRVLELLKKELNISSNSKRFELSIQGIKLDRDFENNLETRVTIHIGSVEHDIPHCYTAIYSNEAVRFREQLIDLFTHIISTALMVEVNVICPGYQLKSIHLDLAIFRKDLMKWTVVEVNNVNDVINNLVRDQDELFQILLIDHGLEHFHTSVTFPKGCVKHSTITFIMLLSTTDKELVISIDAISPMLHEKISTPIDIGMLVHEAVEKATLKDLVSGITKLDIYIFCLSQFYLQCVCSYHLPELSSPCFLHNSK